MTSFVETPGLPGQQISTWLTYVGSEETELTLTQPIPIVAQEIEDEWVIRWLETDISAVGNSLPGAIEAFQAELIDIYRELSDSDPGQLGPLPRRWLKIMRLHFQQ